MEEAVTLTLSVKQFPLILNVGTITLTLCGMVIILILSSETVILTVNVKALCQTLSVKQFPPPHPEWRNRNPNSVGWWLSNPEQWKQFPWSWV